MNITWETSEDRRDDTVAALTASGAQVRERMGFEPLTTIVVTAGVLMLVKAIRSMSQDSKYKGLMIDTTKDPHHVREMPGWPRQQVLVIAADGPHMFTGEQQDDLKSLLTALSPK